MSGREGFVSNLQFMDKNKASKCIIFGLIIAVLFATLIAVSKSMATNAEDWANYAKKENLWNYWDEKIGHQEYEKRDLEIDKMALWMKYQDLILCNIGRIGVNIGLIFIFIGLIAFAINDSLDERSRRTALILAGTVLFVLMITTFFTQISIDAV